MDYFTQEDRDWLENVKQYPSLYQIIIDNDSIWVETDNENGEAECLYTFSTYGYYFIHALLNDMGINVDYC
jgi:hypothetical protein